MTDLTDEATAPEPMSGPGMHDLAEHTFLGRYALLERIGSGGMSVVYKARHLKMDQTVALKVLAPELAQDQQQVRSFNKEAYASSRLAHPNTIKVTDYGESEDGHLFIVMEYLDGETLTELLAREGRLEVSRALHMARQVCKSLAEAHAVGIVHRDLKADNVFICEVYGEKDYVKVLDFGIAKILDQEVSESSSSSGNARSWGSPLYMSPEQVLNSPVDLRSDLYSLGCILYQMLSGQPPFTAEKAIDVVMAHVEKAPDPFAVVAPEAAVPPQIESLVVRMLAKEPHDRPQTAEQVLELIADAEAAAGLRPHETDPERTGFVGLGAVPGTGPHSTHTGPSAIERRASPVALAALVCVLLGAGIGAYLIWRPGDNGDLRAREANGKRETPAAVTAPPRATPEPAKKPAPGASAAAEAKAGPYSRTFLVQTEPTGADVLVGDIKIGRTPIVFRYDPSVDRRILHLRKDGFDPVRIPLERAFVEALSEKGLSVPLATKRRTGPARKPKGKDDKKDKRWKVW